FRRRRPHRRSAGRRRRDRRRRHRSAGGRRRNQRRPAWSRPPAGRHHGRPLHRPPRPAGRRPRPGGGSGRGRRAAVLGCAAMPSDSIASSAPKSAARAAFDRIEGDLVELSHRIHAHPEIKWEEEQASAWVAEALTQYGFTVEAGICDLPTAFQAKAGSGPLHVVVCAEYDALPGIGHACGHNIIAASAVGAGVALAEVADDLGFTVRVMGTPAEEGGGGKILLLKGGAFDGAHLAMMTHPAPIDIAEWPIIAAQQFRVRYTGKEAHASAYPELGRNAADALTVAGVAIGLLRQHIYAGDRVHGIVTHGGEAPNIVPAHTEAEYIVRGATV